MAKCPFIKRTIKYKREAKFETENITSFEEEEMLDCIGRKCMLWCESKKIGQGTCAYSSQVLMLDVIQANLIKLVEYGKRISNGRKDR